MKEIRAQVLVLGSGPGGYTAAFRAADLGLSVVLVDKNENLGGVCLNVGCIPSKALLHVAKVLDEASHLKSSGIDFGMPKIDLNRIRGWKEGIIKQLTMGLKGLAKQRKVTVVEGVGEFTGPNTLQVSGKEESSIRFEHAIIAAGSEPVRLPFLPDDSRVMDSTGALTLEEIPQKLLVIGGGIIGMEMATVYHALGSSVTVVELTTSLLPGVDADLVKPLHKVMSKKLEKILLETSVTQVEAKKDGLYVTLKGEHALAEPVRFDKVLCAVGRVPNGAKIGANKAGVSVDDRGFIAVDKHMRTNVPHIYAIGDIVGQPMLAHKAIPEGKVAAEVIFGKKHSFEPRCIPSVAYTDPEVAWVGVNEIEAKQKGIEYQKGVFPWAASGRSLSMGRSEGMTQLLFDKHKRVIGGGIVGQNAGELIAEIGLAIEMGCDAEDIALTIHPHPTLSETIGQATEAFEGTITDLYLPKK